MVVCVCFKIVDLFLYGVNHYYCGVGVKSVFGRTMSGPHRMHGSVPQKRGLLSQIQAKTEVSNYIWTQDAWREWVYNNIMPSYYVCSGSVRT